MTSQTGAGPSGAATTSSTDTNIVGRKLSARDRARKRIADKLAAERAKEAQNEADLAEVFKAVDSITALGVKRDTAIEKAETDYTQATAAARETMGARLAAMRDRGETVAALVDLTGLTQSDISGLIKVHRATTSAPQGTATPPAPAPAKNGKSPATTTTGDGGDSPGTSAGTSEALGESVEQTDAAAS
ncbi:hypothetical protein [Gordonia sp. N1V]|uniref:hypothetical protein n=1 Tax=Gordonia sp. N1V TaxID=3034163 RepID=UPI0023E0E762|nr:hypothetical protein [Gordonia sp. N1V]MDF3285019.1 hypothetical protein [Gordonia sp. N1V]